MTTIHLLAPILKHRGTPLAYDHKDPNRTLENLIVEAETPPPTPSECEAVFGPSWPWVVSVVETLAAASERELAALDAAWDAVLDAAPDAPNLAQAIEMLAPREAARGAAREAGLGAAEYAALDAAWDAARGVALGAAWEAGLGAVTHHLIGVGDYTQEHHSALVAPFESVFGELKPLSPAESVVA